MEIINDNNNSAPRRLYRSHNNMLAGVCGGVAEYIGIDPTVVRVIAVVMFFMPLMPMTLIYLFMWLIVPIKPI